MELTVFVKKQALKTEGGSVWLCTQKQHMGKYNEQLPSNKVYIAEVKQGQGNVRSPSLVFPWVDHTGLGWCFWMDLDGLYSGGWNNSSNLFTKREKKEWFERFCKDQRVDASCLISRLVAVWINSLMWCFTWCLIFLPLFSAVFIKTMTEGSRMIKFQLLYTFVVPCSLSCLLTIGSLGVTDTKINWGKTWNPSTFFLLLLQLQCGIHKVLFRSDFAFFKEFPEGKLFWLTDRTNMLSLSLLWPQGLVGLYFGLEGSPACFAIISSQLSQHRSPTEKWVESLIIWR